MATHWKKGRGKLGAWQPLVGDWVAEAASEMGPIRCHRSLAPVLGGRYLQLSVRWEIGPRIPNCWIISQLNSSASAGAANR